MTSKNAVTTHLDVNEIKSDIKKLARMIERCEAKIKKYQMDLQYLSPNKKKQEAALKGFSKEETHKVKGWH